MNISWENSESYLLANPSYTQEERARFDTILSAASDWKGHIWLSTSGSIAPKWVGLSKGAILASASAVNKHLASDHTDRWVNPLPQFHIGGLAMMARAHLSGSICHDFKLAYPGKWQCETFYRYLLEVKGTLTALVPAQMHDLVSRGWEAPPSLRAVIIGGGATSPTLYEKAAALKWPLLPSYGLTECASQVATAPLDCWKNSHFPPLCLLSHLQASVQMGCICLSGPSLLSVYAYLYQDKVELIDPKVQGWLQTGDRGYVENGIVQILGREDAIVKVGGENVDLDRLENHLQALILQMKFDDEATLIAIADDRLGHCIHLVSDSPSREKLLPLLAAFQKSVLPFERIRKFHLLPHLPRSSLGKIMKGELMKSVAAALPQDFF